MDTGYRLRKGFTLIELLIVIAIIAILAAILFPVFASARAKARNATCESNLRQLAMGIIAYSNDYDERLPNSNYYLYTSDGSYTGTSPAPDANGNGPVNGSFYWLIDAYVKAGVTQSGGSYNHSIFSCPELSSTASTGGNNIRGNYSVNTNYLRSTARTTCHASTDPIAVAGGAGDTVPSGCSGSGDNYLYGPAAQVSQIHGPSNVVLVFDGTATGTGFNMSGGCDEATFSLCSGYNEYAPGSPTGGVVGNDTTLEAHDSWIAGHGGARLRHNGGSNYAFMDGHVKWFKGPDAPNPIGGDTSATDTQWNSQSATGVVYRQDDATSKNWSGAVGWFQESGWTPW